MCEKKVKYSIPFQQVSLKISWHNFCQVPPKMSWVIFFLPRNACLSMFDVAILGFFIPFCFRVSMLINRRFFWLWDSLNDPRSPCVSVFLCIVSVIFVNVPVQFQFSILFFFKRHPAIFDHSYCFSSIPWCGVVFVRSSFVFFEHFRETNRHLIGSPCRQRNLFCDNKDEFTILKDEIQREYYKHYNRLEIQPVILPKGTFQRKDRSNLVTSNTESTIKPSSKKTSNINFRDNYQVNQTIEHFTESEESGGELAIVCLPDIAVKKAKSFLAENKGFPEDCITTLPW